MGSACYVYAIVGRDTPLPTRGGGSDAGELTIVPWRELAAVTGQTREGVVGASVEAVLHHEAVVEAVRRQGPALPVRFGTVFRDATSVASALAERYEPLAADLARLGDKVELSLTALWTTPPSDERRAVACQEEGARAGGGAGARYMRARAAEQQGVDALKERARALATELDRDVGALALEHRVSLVPTAHVAFRTAYLLDTAVVGEFRAGIEAIRGLHGELRVLLTGPWPPYSFVSSRST